jgi:hypothetical protein
MGRKVFKRRYVVRKCHEGGALGADHKGWTWDVVDRVTDKVMCNLDTRAQAYAEAQVLQDKLDDATSRNLAEGEAAAYLCRPVDCTDGHEWDYDTGRCSRCRAFR